MEQAVPVMSQVVGFVAGFAIFGAIVGAAVKLAFERYTEALHENEKLKAEAMQKQLDYVTQQFAQLSKNFQTSVDKLERIIYETVTRVSQIEAKVDALQRERRPNGLHE